MMYIKMDHVVDYRTWLIVAKVLATTKAEATVS